MTTIKDFIDTNQPLSGMQASIIRALASRGGLVQDDAGQCAGRVCQIGGIDLTHRRAPPGSPFKALEERGLIEREITGKRTFRIELTDAGQQLLPNLKQAMRGGQALLEFLIESGGSFDGGTADLAKALDYSSSRVGDAIRSVERAKYVKVQRKRGYTISFLTITKKGREYVSTWAMHLLDGQKMTGPINPPTKIPKEEPMSKPDETRSVADQRLERAFSEIRAIVKEAGSGDEERHLAKMGAIREIVEKASTGQIKPLVALGQIEGLLS